MRQQQTLPVQRSLRYLLGMQEEEKEEAAMAEAGTVVVMEGAGFRV